MFPPSPSQSFSLLPPFSSPSPSLSPLPPLSLSSFLRLSLSLSLPPCLFLVTRCTVYQVGGGGNSLYSCGLCAVAKGGCNGCGKWMVDPMHWHACDPSLQGGCNACMRIACLGIARLRMWMHACCGRAIRGHACVHWHRSREDVWLRILFLLAHHGPHLQ